MSSKKFTKKQLNVARAFRAKYPRIVRRGEDEAPEWAVGPRSNDAGKYTWYVELLVRQDFRGDVSDIEAVDADAPPRSVTVALVGSYKSGKRSGEVKRLSLPELATQFEQLVGEAVARHGLVPASRRFVRALWRHAER